MIRCVDTFSEIPTIYPNGVFDLARWRAYAQNHFGENISLFEDDMNECLATGSYTFERDYLPVLQAVWQHPWLEEMHQSFLAVVKGLSEGLTQKFGNDLDVEKDWQSYLDALNSMDLEGYVALQQKSLRCLSGIFWLISCNDCENGFVDVKYRKRREENGACLFLLQEAF